MPRILIAEDYHLLRILFTTLFKGDGYDVTLAEDGIELLRLADELQPDVVLTDINMPGINGVEAIKRLGASERTCNIPIIAQSADRHNQAPALTAGAVAFFTKPASIDELLEAVRRAVTPKK